MRWYTSYAPSTSLQPSPYLLQRIRWYERNYRHLGTGCHRSVFAVEAGMVAKVPRNHNGVEANQAELRVWRGSRDGVATYRGAAVALCPATQLGPDDCPVVLMPQLIETDLEGPVFVDGFQWGTLPGSRKLVCYDYSTLDPDHVHKGCGQPDDCPWPTVTHYNPVRRTV